MAHTLQHRANISKAMTKTHCTHGHSLDDAYIVYHWTGGKRVRMRICKQCQKNRMAVHRLNLKEANASRLSRTD